MHKILLLLVIVFFISSGFSKELTTFDIDKPIIKAVVEEGEQTSFLLNVRSIVPGEFTLSSESTQDFLNFYPDKFSIGAGEIAEVSVTLGHDLPGVYVGSLIVKNEVEEVSIPIILEVESPNAGFDVAITEPFPSILRPGDYFKPEVTVYNLRSLDNRVTVEYFIYNLKGERVHTSKQTLNVENNLKFVYNILIPQDLAFGEYVIAITAESGTLGTTSSQITVGESALYSPPEERNYTFLFAGLIIILVAAFLVLNYYWNKKLNSSAKYWNEKVAHIKKKKVREVKVKNTGAEINKLEHQASLLRAAYSKGYIKKESFNEGITKINTLIKQLKKRL